MTLVGAVAVRLAVVAEGAVAVRLAVVAEGTVAVRLAVLAEGVVRVVVAATEGRRRAAISKTRSSEWRGGEAWRSPRSST